MKVVQFWGYKNMQFVEINGRDYVLRDIIKKGDVFIPVRNMESAIESESPSIFCYSAHTDSDSESVKGHSLQHGGFDIFELPVYLLIGSTGNE
jgi:hypothetical protein